MDTKYIEKIFNEKIFNRDDDLWVSSKVQESWRNLTLNSYKMRLFRANEKIQGLEDELKRAKQEIKDKEFEVRCLRSEIEKSIWTRFKNARAVIKFRIKSWIKCQVENW